MRSGIPQSLENQGKLRQLVDKQEFGGIIDAKDRKGYFDKYVYDL